MHRSYDRLSPKLLGYGLGVGRHGNSSEQNRHRRWGPGDDNFAAAAYDEQTSQEGIRKGQQWAKNELEGAQTHGGCGVGGAEEGI
ncbi:hypothetical protein V491_06171 [Pseudogymnoascus sp. VKM F-3775]|nr:hypothetical protein V491_06171 [Pseudogymnoascus sp. VKM F-3775]